MRIEKRRCGMGHEYEIFAFPDGTYTDMEGNDVEKPVCLCGDERFDRLIGGTPTVGITHSKPMRLESMDRTFTSNAQYRSFIKAKLEANPHLEVTEADDEANKRTIEHLQERRDQRAVSAGFSDFEHQRRSRRS